jgi:hypothetical protein
MVNKEKTTRELVIQYRNENPRIRGSTLSKLIGVSKSRIRTILLEEGLPTKVTKIPVFCNQCNIEERQKGRNFCSSECRANYYYIEVYCLECRTKKRVIKTLYFRNIGKARKQFCSHSCRYTWYWKHEPDRMMV